MCQKLDGGSKGILLGQAAQTHEQEQAEYSLHGLRAVGAHLCL